ncbi:hypothetical protein [Roseobacter sinensis]|uniref:Lipoprotein n=1 Tax=Roseobacter sinensis TaxID=2931391 RepID=A0ABT3BCA6_9RHOB|nr:hypothetical protein [Roseobacter sp. WL0113]MCV3271203.1 hypothetical protein [Roseobacter sp. WL0113]
MRLAALCLPLIFCAACVQFPEVDDATDQTARDADYPDLIPLDGVPPPSTEAQTERDETQAALEARVSGLQARAAGLRGAVLSGDDRSRLDDKIE